MVGSGKRKRYHHGSLKEALVAAALELIEESGPAGFSFSEAARRAGVSAAAPYRHFRDRDELIAEVARQGFELFTEQLAAAWNDGRPSPLQAFETMGRAYLEFARTERSFFATMFQPNLGTPDDPSLRQARARSFDTLRDAAEAVARLAPADRRPPAAMVAHHFWALVHGLACLYGDPATARSPIAPEELLEAHLIIYFQGLGILAPNHAG